MLLKQKINDYNNEVHPKYVELSKELHEYKQKMNENLLLNGEYKKLEEKFIDTMQQLKEKTELVNKLNKELSDLKCNYEDKLMKNKNKIKSHSDNDDLQKFVSNELKMLEEDLNVFFINNQNKIIDLKVKYEIKENECIKLKEEIKNLKISLVEARAKKTEIVENDLELEMRLNNKISEMGILQEQAEYYYNMLNAYQIELQNLD